MARAAASQPEQESLRSFGQIRHVLIALSLSVLIFVAAAVSWSIYRGYRETLAAAEQQMLTLAQTVDEHVGRTLDGTVNGLFSVQQDDVFRLCLAARDGACLHAYLQRQIGRTPQLVSYAVAYDDGQLAASSLLHPPPEHNLSQVHYFKVARSQPASPYYIAEQQPDPTGKLSIIPVSTALSDKQGRFVGALIAGLQPAYFQRIYQNVSQNRAVVLDIFRDDGLSLAHFPFDEQNNGRDLSSKTFFENAFRLGDSGVFTETSATDHVTRIYGWRRVSGLPLGIMVGIDRETVLQPWRQESWINGGISALAVLSGSLLLFYLLRQIKRQERTEADLYLTKVAVERGADLAIWLNPHGQIRYVNATACNRLGYAEGELLTMRFRDINPTFRSDAWPRFWDKLRAQKHLFDEITLRTRAGEEFPTEVYSNHIVFKGQEYNCAVVRDISERRLAEEAIIKSEQQLRLALEASSTGLFDMPLDNRRNAVTSPEYDRLLGFEPGELIETFDKWKEQLHVADRDMVIGAFRDYYTGASQQFSIEFRRKVKSGGHRWFQSQGRFVEFDSRNRPTRLIGTMTDITERKEAQERITELANFDSVTGLANRNLLRDELRLAVASSERFGRKLAVLFLDLDRFKTINDSLGHAAGDQVLNQVAERLRKIVRRSDILARLGGDEFVLVLTELKDAMQAGDTAEHLLQTFAEPFELEAGGFATTTSIGISVYPDDGNDPDTLIRNADVAMYQAKSSGRNNFQYFTADMNVRASERLELETSMRHALTNGEFELYYQPQVSLKDNRVIGAEALIRWNHPEQGLISPAKFIPVAEESRMIVPIGNWVLQEACRHAAAWQAAGLPPITIAVNLSPLQLHQSNLLDIVSDAMSSAGLAPQYLEIEVTESVVMQEVEHVMAMLHGIKRLGVKLSIDDFGTGYSSLSYLKRFAFDKLKVDQSFVRDLASDANDAAIVLAIIGLGKTLGMSVLAEGVETPLQLEFLRRAQTDSIQGYLFSRPLNASEFRKLLGNPEGMLLSSSVAPISG
ncbi:PAS domain S-box-containing protein/diguanylate cyclase (GGDEF) domain-containing protein [Andreprevotia lacus DSM 23236]|uniref:PAS domain S-box-containing protein/diguanylate cyclase (GGDEF) domain-containing protein n=1 Tax=Andreprevotia lacus DSM 23236 TaxID=1121001 RepID=A0A1W1X3E5_9NEIS|nr:EAL domain-containing protein [Andreprevotia lacus]SMC18459.1 PAS domain S-box-containing protein/diguanylate cyclase (GGDEF) domain-containing protein [Andreprevotia lacus DSM 23236]